MRTLVKSLWRGLSTLCFPPHCAACHADIERHATLCEACLALPEKIESPYCQRCSQPFHGAITEAFTCSNCEGRELHFECAIAPYLHRGVVRGLIHSFKYEQQLYLRKQLADWIAIALDDPRLRAQPPDAFVPVPLHHIRFREREFNQAAELANLLTRRTGTPTWHALKRIRYTSTQTKLDRNERMENLRGAFRVRQTSRVKKSHLVLIDDVFTTGSTVEECSRVLLRAGAASVRVLTIARG